MSNERLGKVLLQRQCGLLHHYKANLHAHTTLSDGRLTPRQVRDLYREQGYSILAITDHRHYQYHEALCDESFLVLAAYEADLNEQDETRVPFSRIKTYHFNLYDTDPTANRDKKLTSPPPPRAYGDFERLNAYIKEMSELGFLVCYNHPYWSMQDVRDYGGLRSLWGMEIFNFGCEHDGIYGYHPQAYEEMLREGMRLFCVAADDNHNVYPPGDPLCDSFGGFTMIAAKSLDYRDVINALKDGQFYSSNGPLLHEIIIENGEVIVRAEPVEKIYLHTSTRRCAMKLAARGQTIEEARFPLMGDEGFLRVECRDQFGRAANSNAYFLDELT